MKLPSDPQERRAAVIAAIATFVSALVVLVLLFVLTVGNDRRALAEASIPEISDDEEYFLEPELLVIDNPGNEDAEKIDEPAPQPPGEPDPVEQEQEVRVVKNTEEPNEPPVSQKPKMVSQQKEESDVKTSTPKLSAEEEKRLASMSGKLKTDNNGSRTGKDAAESGSGGNGIAMQGSVNGRKMLSCPTWKLRLSQKTVVKVNITVDAEGNVTSATVISGGTQNLRNECRKMALGSKWTKKAGASPASGTITFTITPQ